MGVTVTAIVLVATVVLGAVPASAESGGQAQEAGRPWTLGGVRCELIGVPAAGTAAGGTCPGVRPGALVETDIGECTLNFLLRDGAGHRYIGTAGHCILPGPQIGSGDAGERSWAPGRGPVATDGAGRAIGRFVYAVLADPKDYALIRLFRGVPASPQMCQFGGPTGVNRDLTTQPVTLEYYGEGVGTGSAVPAREGEAPSMANADHVYAIGAAAPGDSGSGVLSADGRAVGVLVTTGLHLGGLGLPVDAGSMGLTRLAPQKARAAHVLGVHLTVVTAATG